MFKEDTMAGALEDGIKMYVLNTSGEERYHPINPEAYDVNLSIFI